MERLLAWYRVGSSVGAVVALVAANLVPLAGVLFLGWSIWTILIVYWLENGIVGFYNVLKMAATAGVGRLGMIPFFVVRYAVFWLAHGVFVLTLPVFMGMSEAVAPTVQLEPIGSSVQGEPTSTEVNVGYVLVAAVGLFISHGISFVFNFVRGGEARRTSPTELMFAPYRRVVILHLTILGGAFAAVALGAELVPLVVLVALKSALDLGFHLREHRSARLPEG